MDALHPTETGTSSSRLLSHHPTPSPQQDMAIHDLDMSRFLMGEEPIEIFATGSCMIDQVPPAPKK